MELPLALRLSIEQRAADVPLSQLRAASEAVSSRYRNETGAGKRLVTTEVDTLAYAVARMPATFGAVGTALRHACGLSGTEIKTVLDVGAGMGTAAWAVDAVIGGVEKIDCLEREPEMIQFGRSLMENSPLSAKTEWILGDMREYKPSRRYDLVVASYALGELRDADREKVLAALWGATDGLLLLVEPGTPLAFSQLRAARSRLGGLGASVLAPCPHSADCPLPDDDWCHFTCRIPRSRLHKLLKGGEVPYEDEKFSYLAVTKEATSPVTGRVLRHPFIESGRVTLKLCTADGLQTRIVTKKQKDAFKAARKAGCGDPFP